MERNKINERVFGEYMEEHADGMSSTYGVVKFTKISFKCIGISSLYDVHTHAIKGLNGLVNGTVLLVIVCIVEPTNTRRVHVKILVSAIKTYPRKIKRTFIIKNL